MTQENEIWKKMMNVWLESALHASTFYLGNRVKLFTRTMATIAVDVMVKGAQEEERSGFVGTATLLSAVETYAKLEALNGAAEADDVKAKAIDADIVDVTFMNCPYGEACGNFLGEMTQTGKFNANDLPCFRAACYGSVANHVLGKEPKYQLVQYAPGIRCRAKLSSV